MATVISGVVRDQDSKPLSNARVAFASGPVSVPDIAALTDSKGMFALSAPAPGTYVIECYADGFSPVAVSVHVVGTQPAHVEIHLEQSRPGTT